MFSAATETTPQPLPPLTSQENTYADAEGNNQEKTVGERGEGNQGRHHNEMVGRWEAGAEGGYLGKMRVRVEPTLVADLVVTLGAGIEVWLAGGRREVRGLAYGAQGAAGKGGDLGDRVG